MKAKQFGKFVFYVFLSSSIAFNIICSIQDKNKQKIQKEVFQEVNSSQQTLEDALSSEQGYFFQEDEIPKGYKLQPKSFFNDFRIGEVTNKEEGIYNFSYEEYTFPLKEGETINPSDIESNIGIAYAFGNEEEEKVIMINKLVIPSEEARNKIDEKKMDEKEIFRIQEGKNIIRIYNSEDIKNNNESSNLEDSLILYENRLKEPGELEKIVSEKYINENNNISVKVEKIPPKPVNTQITKEDKKQENSILSKILDKLPWNKDISFSSYKYPDFSDPKNAYISTVIGIIKKDKSLYNKSYVIKELIDGEKMKEEKQSAALFLSALYGGAIADKVNLYGDKWLEALLIENFVGKEFVDKAINLKDKKTYYEIISYLQNNLDVSSSKNLALVRNKKTKGKLLFKIENGEIKERTDILCGYYQQNGPKTIIFPNNEGGFYFLQN